jgi:methyltransferase (TIGR00027 family)
MSLMSAAIQSAETMAFLRTLVAGETSLAVRCEDYLAKIFLGQKRRLLASISLQAVAMCLMEIVAPGSYGFTIARTRYFDEALLQEARAGIQQLVLLGAGYDSRLFRFHDALRGVCIFEIDHPATQARKQRMPGHGGRSSISHQAAEPCRYSYRAAPSPTTTKGAQYAG